MLTITKTLKYNYVQMAGNIFPPCSVVHSHWSRASECCWRQQSSAIKNQVVASKAHSRVLAGSLWHKELGEQLLGTVLDIEVDQPDFVTLKCSWLRILIRSDYNPTCVGNHLVPLTTNQPPILTLLCHCLFGASSNQLPNSPTEYNIFPTVLENLNLI